MKLRYLVSILLPLSVHIAACSSDDQCNDGTDNDGDGLIDSMDPGCTFNGDKESPDPVLTACNDGVDNDGDGLIDTGDPGCADSLDNDEFNEPIAACNDGIDNDSDGLVDFPNDPGCDFSLTDSEEDDCPSGAGCPDCSNDTDDDEDGIIDYPDDPGCNSAGDTNEFNGDPSTCGTAVLIQPMPPSGTVMGQVLGEQTNELISGDCGGGGEEQVYTYTVTTPRSLVITTDFAETEIDTVVYVRSTCRDPETELGCNDDAGLNVSTLTLDRVEPGDYFIIVDTQGATSTGNYRLDVIDFTPEKDACNPAAPDCAPGLFCRRFVDASGTAASETCENPECSDGENSDGDVLGLVDFPDEPGCDSPEDNDESDTCISDPLGGACPACSNGIDDDSDLLSDYDPNSDGDPSDGDPGCSFAADNVELDECIPGVLVMPLSDSGATGTTEASGNSDFEGSCNASTLSSEDEYAYLNSRVLTNLTFSTVGSAGDTVLYVRDTECGIPANELGCEQEPNAGEEVTIPNPAQDAFYFVFVDGDFVSNIDYVLNVSGTLGVDQACSAADTQFVCDAGAGLLCTSNTCSFAECSDTVDNSDGDGLIDFLDPGCSSAIDNDESDDPSPLPQCADSIDNDMDGQTDFPSDPECSMASGDDEACSDSDTIVSVTTSVTTGTTATATHDYTPSCSMNSTANDIVHKISFPGALDSLDVNTDDSAFDTVLYMRADVCSNVDLACNDDGGGIGGPSQLSLTNVSAGVYYIFVDGFSSNSGAYSLDIAGVISSGEACDDAHISAGILTCASGTTCQSGTCSP